MKDRAFQELLTSIRQAGKIRRGIMKPARVTTFRPADVKSVREKLKASQTEFALMIGVSVATLRNWEQGRRAPDGQLSCSCVSQRASPMRWQRPCTVNRAKVQRSNELSDECSRGWMSND